MSQISLDRLKKAYSSLKKGFKPTPSELERDGLIQRFEFCVELTWKSAKKILTASGVNSDTPKNVFRELGQLGWIDNPAQWLIYVDMRNEASHIYNEETAVKVFSVIEKFIQDCEQLLQILEAKNK